MGKRGPKPNIISKAQQDKIVADLKRGVPMTWAFACAGVAPSTGHYWDAQGRKPDAVDPYKTFALRVADARSSAGKNMLSHVLMAMVPPASRGPDDPPYDAALAISAAKWLLQVQHPDEFTAKTKAEITGANGGPVESSVTMGVVLLPAEEAIPEPTPEALARDAQRAERAAAARGQTPHEPTADDVLAMADPPKPVADVAKPAGRPPTPPPAPTTERDPDPSPSGPTSPMGALIARSHERDGRSRGFSTGGAGW